MTKRVPTHSSTSNNIPNSRSRHRRRISRRRRLFLESLEDRRLLAGSGPVVSSILRDDVSPTGLSSVAYRVRFDEVVAGVDSSDFVFLTTGNLVAPAILDVADAGSGDVYVVTVDTGTGDGTLRLGVQDDNSIVRASNTNKKLGGNQIGDGNFNTAELYAIDKTAPTATNISLIGTPTAIAALIEYNVTFSENVTGVDLTDFGLSTSGVTAAGINNVAGSGTSYVVQVATGTGEGSVQLVLSDNDSIRDLATNPLGGSGTGTQHYGSAHAVDRLPPTVVSISAVQPNPTNASLVDFTITFSEAALNVGLNDFELISGGEISGAMLTNVTGTEDSFTVTAATGFGDGTIQLGIVDPPSITDMAGNVMASSSTTSPLITIDKTAPSGFSASTLDPSPTNLQQVRYRITFPEPVVGVSKDNLEPLILGSDPADPISGVAIAAVSGSGTTYDVTIDTGTGTGDVALRLVNDGTFRDLAGNSPSIVNGSGRVYQIDRIAPTVTSVELEDPSPNNFSSLRFLITLSESVAQFGSSNVQIDQTGFPDAYVQSVQYITATEKHVTVVPGAGEGTISVDIVPNATATDYAGNQLATQANTFGAYTVDTQKPAVSSIALVGSAATSASSIDFDVTFSEPVSNVTAGDFSLATSGITGASITGVVGSGTAYIVTVGTGTFDGTIGLNSKTGGTLHDQLNNPLSANFTGAVATIDRSAPTLLSVSAPASNTNAQTFDYTITFSEAVTGLTTGDLSFVTDGEITSASIDSIQGSGSVYTVTVSTGSGDGTIELDVNASAMIVDAVGNSLASGLSGDVVSVDKSIPSITTFASATPLLTNTSDIYFDVVFSEPIIDFDTSDLVLTTSGLTGASIAQISGNGTNFSVLVRTGTGDGTAQLALAALPTIADSAGNSVPATATTSEMVTIDKTAPTTMTITGVSPAGGTVTNASSVQYEVVFVEPVTGITPTAFYPHTDQTGNLSGLTVSSVRGSGTTYVVTIDIGGGDYGPVLLGIDNPSGLIKDIAGNSIAYIQSTGTSYLIADVAPVVAPTLTLPSPPVTFTEGDTPLLIDPLATITDSDTTDFDGGLVTLEISSNATANDLLSINHEGTGSGQVGVSGGVITYEGVAVATLTGGVGATPLVLSFGAGSTTGIAQSVLRNVQFSNSSNVPSTLPRLVSATVVDGDGNQNAASTVELGLDFAFPVSSTGFSFIHGVGRDAAGNLYVGGRVTGTADVDPGPEEVFLTATVGSQDGFIASYSPTGALRWVRQVGGVGSDDVLDLEVTASGDVYAIGAFAETFTFNSAAGSATFVAEGSRDNYLLKLDSDGNLLASGSYGGDTSDTSLDPNGNLLLTGSYVRTVDIDPGPGTFFLPDAGSTGNGNSFFLKLDSNLNLVWAKSIEQVGGTYQVGDLGRSISSDSSGNVYAIGEFRASFDFDSGPGTQILSTSSDSNSDIYLLKLTPAGDWVWAKSWGSSEFDVGYALTVDRTGNVVVAGAFGGTSVGGTTASVDFDPGTGTDIHRSVGVYDMFVSKFDSAGEFQWARTAGSFANESATEVAVDSLGNVVVGISFYGPIDFDPSANVYEIDPATSSSGFWGLTSDGDFRFASHLAGDASNGLGALKIDGEDRFIAAGYFSGNADFDPGPGTLEFPASSSGAYVWGLSPSGVPENQTVDVVGIDPEFSIAGTDANKAEGNTVTSPFTFTVTRSGDTTGTASVDFAVTGTGTNPATADDFGGTLPSGTVNFADGQATRVITIDVSGDSFVEPDEGFKVTLSNPSSLAKISGDAGDGLIVNDDVAANVAPSLTLPSPPVTFTIGDAPLRIEPLATITDSDSTDFAGGSLALAIEQGVTGNDRLAIRNEGIGAGQIGVAGTDVTFAGVMIGSFVGGLGTIPLVISFNAASTPAAAQALLRNITFENVSSTPSTDSRVVSAVIADGDGGISVGSQELLFGFAIGIGASDYDRGTAIDHDADGNVYVVGKFRGTIDVDPGPGVVSLTSSSVARDEVLILSYDASGALRWAKQLASNVDNPDSDLTVDSNGNVYVTGLFNGTIDVDPGSGVANLTSDGTDGFILKLNHSGDYVAAGGIGGVRTKITTNPAGNVYLTGVYVGIQDFDPGPNVVNLPDSGGSSQSFVLKLDSSLGFVWARASETISERGAWGQGIAVDSAGNVLVTGSYNGTVDFDPGAGVSTLSTATTGTFDLDVYVWKLDSSGNFIWVRGWGSTDFDSGEGIVADSAGNVYTTGFFRGNSVGGVDADPGAGVFNLPNAGNWDIFVHKLDSSGDFVWARSAGSSGGDQGRGIDADGNDNVVVGAQFSSTTDFDPSPGTLNRTAIGVNDAAAWSLDSNGNVRFATAYGSASGGNTPFDVALDDQGNVLSTGQFSGSGDYDPGVGTYNLTNRGNTDLFISKLVPDLETQTIHVAWPAVPALTIDVNAPSISEIDGPSATTVTITRNTDTANAMEVLLTSSDTTEAAIQSIATIPVGQSSVTVNLNAIDDLLIDGDQTVTIIASALDSGGAVGFDSTFGADGLATTQLEMNIQPPQLAMTLQSDGKIVSASEGPNNGDLKLTRHNPDGSLDATFGNSGLVVESSGVDWVQPHRVVLQDDGKILVGGTLSNLGIRTPMLVRYNANGTRDTSYGNNGLAHLATLSDMWIEDMGLTSDGKVLAALGINGTVYFRAMRVKTDGTLDTSFGGFGTGVATYSNDVSASAIDVLSDGRFLLAGEGFGSGKVVRSDAKGIIDFSFGNSGAQTIDFNTGATFSRIHSIRVDQSDRIVIGSFVAGGADTGDFATARLNSDGSFDTTFDTDGMVVTDVLTGRDDFASSLEVQPNGKIVVVGYSETVGGNEISVVRYNDDGSLDTTFDGDGILHFSGGSNINQRSFDSVIQPLDGKLLILAGWGDDFRIGRLNMGGLQGMDTVVVTDNEPVEGPFVVDTLADEDDGDYSAGDLSLREAIRLANTLAGADSIQFASGLSGGTIALTIDQLAVTDDLTITGPGASDLTISGNDAFRIIKTLDSAALTLEGLTITGGRPNTPNGVNSGGGVSAFGDLELRDVVVTGNVADGPIGDGGGIFHNNGNLNIIDSVVSNNTTTGSSAWGGGVRSFSSNVLIQRSVIAGNTMAGASSVGVGVIVINGNLRIEQSTISGNVSTASNVTGGGVTVGGGNVTITDSTVSTNSVTGSGAGIAFDGNGFVATVTNSTVSGNIAGVYGGGIANFTGTMDLNHSTVTANSAPAGSGAGVASFETKQAVSVRTTIFSSIVSGNINSDVDHIYTPGPTVPADTVFTGGFNVIGIGNVVPNRFNAPTDQTGIGNPGLATLANNGGLTLTHALLVSSPAINAGDMTSAETTDQRGLARVAGGNVDVGAFELQTKNPSVTLSVDNINIVEAAGVTTFTATLSEISSDDVTVNLGFAGTATRIDDYTIDGTTIVIPAGQLTAAVSLTAVQDALVEDAETVIVDISSVTGGSENGTQRQTITILDDDGDGGIQGFKWNDVNGDGVFDGTESGLQGWTIFLDQNQNRVLDAGELSTVTGPGGSYSFTGLLAGSYYLAEVPQTGWQPTFPADSWQQQTKLFVSNATNFSNGTLSQYNLDGSGQIDLVSAAVYGFGLDEVNGKLYWSTSANGHVRSDLDGQNVETTGISGNAYDFDAANNRLFFTLGNRTYVADLNTLTPSQLHLGLNSTSDLEYDPISDTVFVVNNTSLTSGDAIYAVPADGSLANGGAPLPKAVQGISDIGGVAVDSVNRNLYFTDGNWNTVYIQSLDGDGTDRRVIVDRGRFFGDGQDIEVAPELNLLVWRDAGFIYRAKLDGSDVQTIPITGALPNNIEIPVPFYRVTVSAGETVANQNFGNQQLLYDFGDAPSKSQTGFVVDYPVTLLENGARHVAVGPTLGSNRDSESVGVHSIGADSDDSTGSADDDGIVFNTLTLLTSTSSDLTFTVDVTLQNADPVSNRLDAWIDFDRDGSWLDTGEQIFDNFDLGTTNGTRTLTFTVPRDTGANVEPGATYARFRLSTAGDLFPTTAASDGEVEDYLVILGQASDGVDEALSIDVGLPSVSESDGVAATTVTVTRNYDLDVDLTVALSSDDASEATVPTTITIPAGQTSAVVYLDALNDAIVDGTQTATITATVKGVALDTSFGTGGIVSAPLHDVWGATTLQADGKIVSVTEGITDGTVTITRHHSDGALDATFGADGAVEMVVSTTTARMFPERVLIQSDGKIVIGGRTGSPPGAFLLRLNADGTADSTYGNGGIADLSGISADYRINDLDLTSDGKVLAAVTRSTDQVFRALRVKSNGTVDTTFGTAGILTITSDTTVAVAIETLPDGKFILFGSRIGVLTVVRANADGSLDATFGDAGRRLITWPSGFTTNQKVKLDPLGRIVIGATHDISGVNGAANFTLARLTSGGDIDTNFGSNGIVITDVMNGRDDISSSIEIDADGKIWMIGYADPEPGNNEVLVIRYNTDGSIDRTFDSSGVFNFAGTGRAVQQSIDSVMQPDGSVIILSGSGNEHTLTRLNPNVLLHQSADTIDVTDDDTPLLTVTIADASILENGGVTTATVSRNTDTTNALTITLTSSDTGEAIVPATVTIPAGRSTSDPFTISGVDDTIVDGTQTVTITAGATTHANGTSMIDVTDDVPDTSVGLNSSNDLLIQDILGGDSNDMLTISINGPNIRVHDPNHQLRADNGATSINENTVEIPITSLIGSGGIIFDTLGGDDSLIIDFSGGLFSKVITFNGGSQNTAGDTLVLTGGGTFADASFTYGNENNGSIDVTGNSTIVYTGLEPLTSNITAANVTLNYSTESETIVVSGIGSGQTHVDSDLGGAATTFHNPVGTLMINAGDMGANTITIASLVNGFSGEIAVNGGSGGDTVRVDGAISLANASLTIVADMIDVGSAIYTNGGNISLTALGDITIRNSVSTAGGAFHVDADADRDGNGAFTLAPGSSQQQKVSSSDLMTGDFMGSAVAIDGDTAIATAPGNDDSGDISGSVYIFTRIGGVWYEQQKLNAPDGGSFDWFGMSVSLSGDTAVVGAFRHDHDATDTGTAYVFTRSGGVWTLQQELLASDASANDWFGRSVSVDGDTIVVGSSRDDDVVTNSGSVYVFTRSGGVWTQQQKLTASDAGEPNAELGNVVSIDGDTMVAGAVGESAAGLYSGAAYVFHLNGGVWTEQQKLTASDAGAYDRFGTAVSVSADSVLIGADGDDATVNDSGAAYVFTRSDGAWTEQQKLVPLDPDENDSFGRYLSIEADTAVVGSVLDDDDGNGSGSAYIFQRIGSVWAQRHKLTASDGAISGSFGGSVSISGDTVFVGAQGDSSAGFNSGAAYFLTISPSGFVSTGSGPILISAGSINLQGTITGTGTLVIKPSQPSATIGLGGGSGDLNVDDVEIRLLADGFSSITIGDTTSGSGTVNVDTALFNNPVTIAGGKINDLSGIDIIAPSVALDGMVAPGQSPGVLEIIGDLTLIDGNTIAIEVSGTAGAGVTGGHDQIMASGQVTIGASVTLLLIGDAQNATGIESLMIVQRNGGTGTFAEMPEGQLLVDPLGTGQDFRITYVGGDGDDIELRAQTEPNDITLSQSSINENIDRSAADLLFAELSAVDPDPGDSHTFDLVSGDGDADNGRFQIVGSQLYLKQGEILDFETQSSYAVRVLVTDSAGLRFETSINLTVNNLVEVSKQDITVGDGTDQRSRVESISIQFDAEVTPNDDAFTVTNREDGGIVAFTPAWSVDGNGHTVVTLTFSGAYTEFGSLVDGNYQLAIDGTKIVSLNGHGFDADGAGIVGDELVFGDQSVDGFYRYFGDTDGDRDVDRIDYFRFRSSYGLNTNDGLYDQRFDLDGDGDVDRLDYFNFRNRYGTSLPFTP